MNFLRPALWLTMVLMVSPLRADHFTPVNLASITHATATLTVTDPNGQETVYTPAMIEQFPTYSVTTTTPWRHVPATFEGALLSDILARHSLGDASVISVSAENDYATTFNQELIRTIDILVATRVNGRAHSRRHRGPIQLIIDANDYAASPLTSENHLVWMASRIEAEK